VRTPKQARAVVKEGAKTKAERPAKKAREELAKERRRAGRVGQQKTSSSGPHRGEKQRQSHDR
jgi:hypothetical protein